MRSFAEVAGKPLEWVRVGRKRDLSFELLARGELVGALDFRTRLGADADGQAADGAWSFERQGVIRSTVEIRGQDGEVAAILRPGRLLRPMTLDLGETALTWEGVGAFPRWQALKEERGSIVLRCRTVGVPAAGKGVMHIEPPGFGRLDLSLLCLTAWYLQTSDQGQYAG